MFYIRQSKPDDIATLLKLARMVYFFNLPPDERILAEKIAHSTRCFARAATRLASARAPRTARVKSADGGLAEMDAESDLFMFSILDADTHALVGTSQIRAHQGGPGNPNWSLKLSERKFFSPRLGQGTTHTVAKLHGDESGPTEIGGLILDPGFRGRKPSPGKFLSFVRFHFIALHRKLFADTILAEMMAPVTSDGDSVFWDHVGRKFIPVKYAEADRFCQHNRGFIEELLPKEEIYLTLLPLEVQNIVAMVGRDTLPARALLESLGFRYRGYIDPFDGGPHLDAPTDSISLVTATTRAKLGKPTTEDRCKAVAIFSTLSDEPEFRSVLAPFRTDASGAVQLPQQFIRRLHAEPGDSVGCTPIHAPDINPGTPAQRAAAPASTKKPARSPRAAPVARG